MDNFQSYREWITRLNEANKDIAMGISYKVQIYYSMRRVPQSPKNLRTLQRALGQSQAEAAEKLYYEGNKIYNGNRNRARKYKQALEKYEASITYIKTTEYHIRLLYITRQEKPLPAVMKRTGQWSFLNS